MTDNMDEFEKDYRGHIKINENAAITFDNAVDEQLLDYPEEQAKFDKELAKARNEPDRRKAIDILSLAITDVAMFIGYTFGPELDIVTDNWINWKVQGK